MRLADHEAQLEGCLDIFFAMCMSHQYILYIIFVIKKRKKSVETTMYIYGYMKRMSNFRMNVCLFMSYLFLMGNEIISFRMITSSPKYILYVGTRWKFEDPDVLIILVSFGPIMLPGSATKST